MQGGGSPLLIDRIGGQGSTGDWPAPLPLSGFCHVSGWHVSRCLPHQQRRSYRPLSSAATSASFAHACTAPTADTKPRLASAAEPLAAADWSEARPVNTAAAADRQGVQRLVRVGFLVACSMALLQYQRQEKTQGCQLSEGSVCLLHAQQGTHQGTANSVHLSDTE